MTGTSPRHPNVRVRLTGEDGNAFAILGRITEAMRRAGIPDAEIDEFVAEATDSDYEHLLQTCMRWVDVE
jgi:hypothetical protein